jgi:alkyldihydroxyacetonephosphate synthase
MSGLVSIDTNSRLARFLPGTSGPEAERLLAISGLTIGHFPQSFMHATLGGFAATRSSGQASTGYGRFDANVKGLELIAPTGGISLAPSPGTAAGPDLRELIVGSEGTLGVITSVDLQLAESPALIEDRAWLVESFAAGREILQRLEQADCAPAVARLSDEDETEISLRLSASGRKGELLSRYSAARGISHPCILITGFEGSESELPARIRRAYGIVRSCGAVSLGESAGKAWRHGRFAGPYLRDVLMDRGLLVETLETSAPWSGLERLYRGVSDALHASLARAGGEPIVMCHVSHLYPTGASLYFTFIGNQPGETLEEQIAHWSTVKDAAGDAIKACGGTITHHHAVGVDHSHWMDREVGELGLEALRAVKDRLDPQGIMNPGKLIPEG